MKTEKDHETESYVFKIFIWIIIWNSFVSYMTLTLIDSDHMDFFFHACRCISWVGLEESGRYS